MTTHIRTALYGILIGATLVQRGEVSAQARADFSGRWTVEQPTAAPGGRGGGAGAGTLTGTMGSGWGSEIMMLQTPKRLTVEYAFFGRGDMQAPLKFVYALDSTETRDSVMMGRGFDVDRSMTMWDGATLVIVTKHFSPNPAGSGPPLKTEVMRKLSLESPTSLVIETTRDAPMGGVPSTTRTVYKKL